MNISRWQCRRGLSALGGMAILITLTFVLALGVDIGLRRLVDAELQSTADAAAIAGARRLMICSPLDPPHESKIDSAAISAIQENATTRGEFVASANDIDIGFWDADGRQFTAAPADQANAVRAQVSRTTERGNAIPTILGGALGADSMSSSRMAIAMINTPPDYALIGLEGFSSQGVLTVDGSPWTSQGNIASNGDVKLNLLGLIGVSLIDGHIATRGNVQTPLIGLLTKIKDGIRRPDKPFVLPSVSLDQVTLQNDNANLGSLLSGNNDLNILLAADLPEGTYVVNNLNIVAGAILKTKGPVTLYVKENVNIIGTVLAWNSDPANLKIRVAGPGHVVVAANVTLSADIYAPKNNISIAAGVVYRGRLIGRRIDILGTSLFFLRPDLPPPELGRPRVTLVQ